MTPKAEPRVLDHGIMDVAPSSSLPRLSSWRRSNSNSSTVSADHNKSSLSLQQQPVEKKPRRKSSSSEESGQRQERQVLRVYSSFRDNFQGSARIAQVLESAASLSSTNSLHHSQHSTTTTCQQPLCELELHAYYLPPDDLPIASLCHLLQQQAPTLETLGLYHLRLTPQRHHHNDNDPALAMIHAMSSLRRLQRLTWDPILSSLWEDTALQTLFWTTLSQLPALRQLYLSVDEHHLSEPVVAPELHPQQQQHGLVPSNNNNQHHPCRTLPTLMNSLTSLRLSNCTLTMEACQLLAQGLQQQQQQQPGTLKRLDLSSCLFSETRGCLIVVDALSYNRGLQVLDFTDCRFGYPDDNGHHNNQNDPRQPPPHEQQQRQRLLGNAVVPPQAHVMVHHLLLETLELYNTTLQEVHGVKLWGLCTPPGGMMSNSSASCYNSNCWSILDMLLVLNQSGVRAHRHKQVGVSLPSALTNMTPSSSSATTALVQNSTTAPWPYILRQVAPLSPTVAFQLLMEQANTLLCNGRD